MKIKPITGLGLLLLSCTQAGETGTVRDVAEHAVIHASYEQTPDSKTVLQDDGAVYWMPDDVIGVFFGAYNVPFYNIEEKTTATADFIGNPTLLTAYQEGAAEPSGAHTYYGIFPAHAPEESAYYGTVPARDKDKLTLFLPAAQRGKAGSFERNVNIAVAKSADYHQLRFFNLCGGVRFRLEGSDIVKVLFEGNDGEALAGLVTARVDAGGIPTVQETLAADNAVSLSMENGEAFTPGTWYYMVMLPTDLKKGYTMTFLTEDGARQLVENSAISIKRSVFGSLDKPDKDLPDSKVPVESVELDIKEITLTVLDDEVKLTATVKPDNAYDKTVVWSSSDPTVVVVSQDGYIAGLKPGTAVITATAGKHQATCQVTVEEVVIVVENITLNRTDVSLRQGASYKLKAVISPSDATYDGVNWSSSDERITTVDQTGLVYAKAEGAAVISVEAGGKKATCRVTVSNTQGGSHEGTDTDPWE